MAYLVVSVLEMLYNLEKKQMDSRYKRNDNFNRDK